MLTKKGEVKENIPNQDKSRFSLEKWKFMVDAPFEVSANCCGIMKKAPAKKYEKETGKVPMIAMMAEESVLRENAWLKHGCNAFDAKRPKSNPMSFWTENDVLEYIYKNDLKICSVYGDVIPVDDQLSFADMGLEWDDRKQYMTTGCKRTGCMLCGFGLHLDKSPNRLEILKETHPKMYALIDVMQNNGVTFREAIEWMNEHGGTKINL